jgi:hypothetical protein
VVPDRLLKLAFKLADGLEAAFQYVGVNRREVVFAPLELPSSCRDKIGCGQLISEVQDEEISESDIVGGYLALVACLDVQSHQRSICAT